MGGGCKLSFLLDWLGRSVAVVAPSLAQTTINLLISRSPSSLKLFFFYEEEESSYNQTLVTDLTAAERRKHSFNNLHICAWYTAGQAQPVEGCWSFLSCGGFPQQNKTRRPNIEHVLKRPGWRLETFWLSLVCHFVGSPCPSCSEKR